MGNYIDIVCNLYTPQVVEEDRMGIDDAFKEQVRMPEDMRDGVSIEDYLLKMDDAGIERSLLIGVRGGDLNVRGSFEVPYAYVQTACEAHPTRFSGLAGIDPTRGMQGLKELEVAVKEHGFVGAHWYPHWFSMPPNAAQIYPYYAKCCELDIPIMMQVGQNLVYNRERRLPSVARPILLDQVAIDFPDLRIIGIHIGIPWTDEMIAMCWKHENVFTAGDAYAPRYWPEQYVHYANTIGRHKVMFGTDWPVISPERGVQEVNNLGLKPESHALLMRENALRVFNLPNSELI
ncbi:MAG: amidohydrolase [Gammaproteobacteria bacterium]|nr:amidohydrolase [Gammaproteobacteria bacterium]MDG1234047.1 amidohydrolase family protein [Pseudomonadales bacterium]MBT5156044.1 amidohydrolase [Gammaproteobacteria bacterium]MBT5686810.1 amidohydrolase [Gammaproteobacteria bacterium]MBT5723444.1 amidohydrolase [Gammaproteobacteria bacterium]